MPKMPFKPITPNFAVSPQLASVDIEAAKAQGFTAIIDARPDGEDRGRPSAADMARFAQRNGLAFHHIPVTTGGISDADIAAFSQVLDAATGRVLGYCRSGTRAALLWGLAQAGRLSSSEILDTLSAAGFDGSVLKPRLGGTTARYDTAGRKRFDIVIVGGGSAGIAAAASLLKRRKNLSIAVIEPAETHDYQPGWTLVGAGVFTQDSTRHTMASVMPDAVTWVKQACVGFAPESDEVILADGASVKYRVLIAAPGLKLHWDAIPGLSEALGKHGVTSNYRFDLAPYTHRLVTSMKAGRALFTQPPMPIKCAGAPQKAMYLSCDIMRESGALAKTQVEFHNAGAVLFGVAAYVPALMDYIKTYRIDLQFGSKLVAVDGPNRRATFEQKSADGAAVRIERGFDMLHAVPPQVAPDFVAASPLAGDTGFIQVDHATLQHPRYHNVFALGDACATSNAKTAAAARKQAPVVAVNALAMLGGKPPSMAYDGYGSCPLTVERGKIVLAEFGYGGKLLPSFPSWLLDGTKPTRAAWYLKDRVLPMIYWHGMLKGREWLAAPQSRDQAA
jgi:sulfide:quinone oxidoreductase